jgi:nicotinamidase-related amidase
MPNALRPLTGSATALVLIECQNGIVGADGALPELAAAAAPILPVLARLADGVRAAGGLVVHLIYVPALGNRSSNRKPLLFEHVLKLMQDWTPEHPATQVVDEIGVDPRDLVLPRHSGMSPTYNTELFAVLRNAGYDSVILGGVSLNVAIPVVATQAADEGFTVIVPVDGVAGTPADHAASMLRYTVSFLAHLARSTDIVAAFTAPPPVPAVGESQ